MGQSYLFTSLVEFSFRKICPIRATMNNSIKKMGKNMSTLNPTVNEKTRLRSLFNSMNVSDTMSIPLI